MAVGIKLINNSSSLNKGNHDNVGKDFTIFFGFSLVLVSIIEKINQTPRIFFFSQRLKTWSETRSFVYWLKIKEN